MTRLGICRPSSGIIRRPVTGCLAPTFSTCCRTSSNTTLPLAFQDGGTAWAYCTAPAFPWLLPPMTLPSKAFAPAFAIRAFAASGALDAIGEGSIFQVQPTPFLGNCDPTRAATAHAGGIQVGLADSSVRTLSPAMSGKTWWAAVTPAGGEVLGSDW